MAGPPIAPERSGPPQELLLDLKWPPHSSKFSITPTNSKWNKDLSSGILQDKDLEEMGGKGKHDAEPRSTSQLCLPSMLGYLITSEPNTQRDWVKRYGQTFGQ